MENEQSILPYAPTYEHLKALYEAIQGIGSTLDLGKVLSRILHTSAKLANAGRGFILWESAEDNADPLYICHNLTAQEIDQPTKDLIRSVRQGASETLKPHAFIILPLWAPAGAAGTLYVSNPTGKKAFTVTDLTLLTAFTQQATAAIQNALTFEKSQAAQAKFGSLIAHDLRLPITAIRGYSELMLKEVVGALNDAQKNFLSIIHRNTDYAASLISNLSDVIKIDNEQLHLKCEHVSLGTVVEEVLDAFEEQIEEKQQTITRDFPELPPVWADKFRLKQVLTILIENAHRYTAQDGEINFSARLEENNVRLIISDTGIGIEPDDQARLFTKFFRADHPTVQDYQGSGLNLYVAKRLVELMRGSMGVESTTENGSTFWLTLPIATG